MSFADKCPHCEHDKCCFCGKEKSMNINKQREALLRFVAVRENRPYDNVLAEYQGRESLNNGLYTLVETAVAFMNAPTEIKIET